MFLIVLALLSHQSQSPQSDAGLLTLPARTTISVPQHQQTPQSFQLTRPSSSAVPNEISAFDYQEHMGFQRNEDLLQTQMNVLSEKIIGLEDYRLKPLETSEGKDRADLEDLQASRTKIQTWFGVLSTVWVLLGGFISRETWLTFFRKALHTEKPS